MEQLPKDKGSLRACPEDEDGTCGSDRWCSGRVVEATISNLSVYT